VAAHAASAPEPLPPHVAAARAHADAWRYACIAGRRACARYANHDAAASLERAVEAARHLPDLPAPERAAVWELLGDVRERVGSYGDASAAYRSARRLVRDDPVAAAGLLLKEAWIPERTGRASDALRWIRKGLAAVDGVGGPAAASRRAQLASWFGTIRQSQGRAREAIEWCERAIAEAEVAGDRDAEAHARITLDWCYVSLGRGDEATHSPRALELYESLGDLSGQARVENNLGGFAYWAGRWDAAAEHYDRARELELRTGDAVNAATATANLGEVLSDQGRLDDAEGRLRDALRVFRAARYGFNIGFATSLLGRIAARRGRFPEAHDHLAVARRELTAAGLPDEVVRVDAWTAEAFVMAAESARALALADATLARVRTDDAVAMTPLLHRVRAHALAQQGDAAAAVIALDASLAAAREHEMHYEIALTLDAMGEIIGDAAATMESRAMLERLGVARVPPIPRARRAS
jgi:tetratricopeptide (TPR) repeat protein